MNKRLLKLLMVLAYDSDIFEQSGKRYFTSGQRILINKERSQLLNDIEDHQQSEIVNEKVDFVFNQIVENKLTDIYSRHVKINLS